MQNDNNELCEEGQRLWLLAISDYNDERYMAYIDHIKSCEECRRGLEIYEIISDKELDVFATMQKANFVSCGEGRMEEYIKVQRACLSSYAEGIKDALVLAAVMIILFSVGVYVFIL